MLAPLGPVKREYVRIHKFYKSHKASYCPGMHTLIFRLFLFNIMNFISEINVASLQSVKSSLLLLHVVSFGFIYVCCLVLHDTFVKPEGFML